MPQEQPLRPLRVPLNAQLQGMLAAPQPAKPACPACQSDPSNHPSVLASLCDFHSTTPIPQRNRQDTVLQTELFSLPLPNEGVFARTPDNIAPSVEHIEYSFSGSQNPAASEQYVSPDNGRRSRVHGISVPSIMTGGVNGLRTARQSRSFSPQSSTSSTPDSPKLQRESSPTFTNSPVEHFSSWTHRDSKTSAELSTLNPYADITRLRVNSQGHGSLYPGSTFSGSQRSGASSYDVTVTIVSTDFASSVLCGYLRIRNLTKDYPELTTYFHAEIIGSRYGFLTDKEWGATESDDLTHWSKFGAFRSMRNQLKRPGLTLRDHDRGTVFMRWKERFLVPDHKTKEINGASFAGFYYVAVSSPTEDSSSNITAFYFHPQSEPYQQLSLHHIPEATTSSFEFC